MSVLTGAARAALGAGRLAHLVTVDPDGSPQVSIVWVGVDGDEIVCAHLGQGPELLQQLAEVYLGPGVRFPPFENPPPGHVIRIGADRVAGVGPWTPNT